GAEIHMLAEMKYPLIKETLKRMISLRLVAGTASEDAYTLFRFIQKQIDEYGSHDGEFKNHLSDNEESLGEDASKQRRINDADAEVTFIDETSRFQTAIRSGEVFGYILLVIKKLTLKKLND
ncbi:hypothetical protein Tco_1087816, partial [Tanacetum coccineum]